MLKVTNLLETIGSPQDLRDCDPSQLPQLAHDLREYILKSVAKTGGHLSSNLGTVELSLALHYVLNTPEDRIIWDVGHIAHFEELWLTQNLDGPIEFSEMPGMYNPFEHPRATRASLPIPPLHEMIGRLQEIRERVLERLDSVDFDDANPLLANGYVYHMVLQHEYQHNETILQTLQLKQGRPYSPVSRFDLPTETDSFSSEVTSGMVRFPGGSVEIGTHDRSTAYDNERPRHTVDLAPAIEAGKALKARKGAMAFVFLAKRRLELGDHRLEPLRIAHKQRGIGDFGFKRRHPATGLGHVLRQLLQLELLFVRKLAAFGTRARLACLGLLL